MKFVSFASQLGPLVQEMGAEPVEFIIKTKRNPVDPINLLEGPGLDVELTQVAPTGGLLSYEGRQIVLYIPDQGSRIDEVLINGSQGKKVHVADCRTLDDMRKKNRFEQRYRAVGNTTGTFEVFGTSYSTGLSREGTANLRVCINCLKHLNYKGYVTEPSRSREILHGFDLENFFLSYSTLFRTLPSTILQKQGGYAANWSEISRELRKKRNWQCESCGLYLSENRDLLDAHHENGNKADNNDTNLKALCKDCHRKQPMHGHMGISSEDMVTIQRLRHRQGVLSGDHDLSWKDCIDLVDTSFEGLLRLYENDHRVPDPPEVGYEVLDGKGVIKAQAEVAWPDKKFAVVMDKMDENEKNH